MGKICCIYELTYKLECFQTCLQISWHSFYQRWGLSSLPLNPGRWAFSVASTSRMGQSDVPWLLVLSLKRRCIFCWFVLGHSFWKSSEVWLLWTPIWRDNTESKRCPQGPRCSNPSSLSLPSPGTRHGSKEACRLALALPVCLSVWPQTHELSQARTASLSPVNSQIDS